MAFTSLEGVDTEEISPQQLEVHEQSWERTQGPYAVEATSQLADISQGEPVSDFEEGVKNLTRNGTYEGSLEQTNNYFNWSQDVIGVLPSLENVEMDNLSVKVENLTAVTSSDFEMRFEDLNRSFKAEDRTDLYSVEDPLLAGTDTRNIEPCNYDYLAEKQFSGSDSNGTARGKPVVEPSDASSASSDEILITSNVSSYNSSNVQNYAGYSSETIPGSPSNYNSVYLVGADGVPDFGPAQRAIISDGLWKSNFFHSRNSKCYFPTSHLDAPGVDERIEGDSRGSEEQGVFTVLSDEPYDSNESDIGYQRVDDSGISLVEIDGVSNGGGETWPGFRMGSALADSEGISGLK